MKNLLSFVYEELRILGVSVYNKQPPTKAEYPFIKYQINQSYRETYPSVYSLTIDVWDRNDSTYRVENLTDKVDSLMENLTLIDECMSITSKRQTRLNVSDPDAEIKRRRLEYQLRVFRQCKGVN